MSDAAAAPGDDERHRPPRADSGGREVPPPHDAVGAYVLDALPTDERRAFEAHLWTCEDCRRAVAELSPVVALLPRLYDRDPVATAGGAPAPRPSTDLGRRIVDSARLGGPSDRAAPAAIADRASASPGLPSAPAPIPLLAARRSATGWAAAAVLAIVAAGAIVWGLMLQLRLDERQDEIAAQRARIADQAAEIDDLRQRAEATLFALAPTADGPSGAVGNVLYAAQDHFGVLYVRGLPPLPEGQIYQLWYIDDGTPRPGGTFDVDPQGVGSLALTDDVQQADGVALTIEPDGGSDLPTTAPLLAGSLDLTAG